MARIASSAGDVTRLPKWAQRRIEVLERALAYERAKLAQGPEGSMAFADPHSEAPRPLGPRPHIRFLVGETLRGRYQEIDISLADRQPDGIRRLQIMGSDSILVCPRSTNLVEIEVKRR